VFHTKPIVLAFHFNSVKASSVPVKLTIDLVATEYIEIVRVVAYVI